MLLAHAPDTAHKEDADHGQYSYGEPNVADHGFLPRGSTATQRNLLSEDGNLLSEYGNSRILELLPVADSEDEGAEPDKRAEKRNGARFRDRVWGVGGCDSKIVDSEKP